MNVAFDTASNCIEAVELPVVLSHPTWTLGCREHFLGCRVQLCVSCSLNLDRGCKTKLLGEPRLLEGVPRGGLTQPLDKYCSFKPRGAEACVGDSACMYTRRLSAASVCMCRRIIPYHLRCDN